jgi:hypothetical protein
VRVGLAIALAGYESLRVILKGLFAWIRWLIEALCHMLTFLTRIKPGGILCEAWLLHDIEFG